MVERTYEVIYADPPWRYREKDNKQLAFSHGKHGKVIGIEKFYATMPLCDIKVLEVPSSEDAWLLLWATATRLPEALEVLNAWGFKYWTCAIWDKIHLGLGWFFRVQHEILLVGKKGKPKLPEVTVRSIFAEKRTTHATKPVCVKEWIELAFPNRSKIELFARAKSEGWDVWGDEVNED